MCVDLELLSVQVCTAPGVACLLDANMPIELNVAFYNVGIQNNELKCGTNTFWKDKHQRLAKDIKKLLDADAQ